MCGITGIISKSEISRSVIESMTAAVAHRGPDAQGIYLSEDRTVALGHRRLSVIDLSTEANQPMTSGQYTVVFNGEIYNFKHLRSELEQKGYRFSTASDTEVIIRSFDVWGTKSFSKLRGMFALALYDREKGKIYLARDPFGKKPLFVYRDDERIAFASEVKSLLAIEGIDKRIDKTALAQFLHLGYIPGPRTAWNRIEKFPSSAFGTITADRSLTFSSYADASQRDIVSVRTEDHAADQLEALLQEAVKSRLISDVPLGAFLSGGTDSSLVSAVASKLITRKLNTFTIGFEDASFDESQYAARVSSALGTDHHLYMLKEKDALELVEPYMQHFDEPFADSSAIPVMLLSKHARKEVTVALTGDGGDELFLGYGTYAWASRVKMYSWTRNLLKLSTNRKAQKAVAMFADIPDDQRRSHIFSQEQGFFSAKEVEQLTGIEMASVYQDPSHFLKSEEEKQAFFDLFYYLKDNLLVKVDRGSMKYALECRCPLLDPSLVEYALQLPYEFKIRNGVSKYLLKKLLSKYLPDDLVHRKKWGFGIPLGKWLRGDLQYLIQDYLAETVVSRAGFVNPSTVTELVRRFNNGEDELYHRVWVLVCLHYWFVRNVD